MADLSLVFDLLARDRASSEVKKVGDSMQRAGDDADGFGDRVKGAFGALAGVAAGAGLAVGAAFGAALEREALNDKLAAQLALTPGESARVGEVAGSLFAGAYGGSMEEVNTAVGAVMTSIDGMATASSSDLEGMTATALDFASAFDTDVTRAAQIAGQMLRTGLAADGQEAFDLLVTASQQVPAAVREDLLDATDEYGQFFAGLGYTGPQAMALLVDAAEKGTFGIDKLGDSMKEFTIRSTDMSASSSAAYESIGMDAQEMSNRILAGGDTAYAATQEIVDGLLGITDPAKQAEAAIALFGTPLEDLSVQEIPAFLEALGMANGELENVEGAAGRMGDTLNSNTQTSLTTLSRTAQQTATGAMTALLAGFTGGATEAEGWAGTLQNAAATVSDALGPALDTLSTLLTDTVGPALEGVFGYLSEHETAAAALGATISGVLALAFTVWGTRATIAAATNAAAWFSAVFASTSGAATTRLSALQVVASWALMGVQAAAHGARIAAVWAAQIVASAARGAAGMAVSVARVVAGWVLMAAQSLLQAARMAAAWLIALGPVGWVIAAVVGLVAVVVANWDRIRSFTVGAWNAVAGAVSSGVERVVSFVRGLGGRVLGAVSGFGSMLLSAGGDLLRGLWNGISGSIGWLRSKVGSFFGSLLPGWVRDMLGIASPSKVFAEFGRDTMLGYAVGIEQGAGAAVAAVDAALGDVVRLGDVSTQVWDQLLAQGWKGRAGDRMEALYRPAGQTRAPAYSPPRYDLAGGGGGAAAASRTVHVSGVVGPEEVAAIVRREQATDEFLVGAGAW